MKRQEQAFGQPYPAEGAAADAPASPARRRWGSPAGAAPRRVWLGGGSGTAAGEADPDATGSTERTDAAC